MRIQGAVIKEQGVVFAIVIVKQFATQTTSEAQRTREAFRNAFSGMPVVLASQDSRGRFTYQGRNDLVRFLASISPARIPWKEYNYA